MKIMVRQKGSYDRVWSMAVSPTFRQNTTQYHEIHPLPHSGCEGLNKSTELDEEKFACQKEGETSRSGTELISMQDTYVGL